MLYFYNVNVLPPQPLNTKQQHLDDVRFGQALVCLLSTAEGEPPVVTTITVGVTDMTMRSYFSYVRCVVVGSSTSSTSKLWTWNYPIHYSTLRVSGRGWAATTLWAPHKKSTLLGNIFKPYQKRRGAFVKGRGAGASGVHRNCEQPS